jgi:uncharacterized alkaline shock family protein YloU
LFFEPGFQLEFEAAGGRGEIGRVGQVFHRIRVIGICLGLLGGIVLYLLSGLTARQRAHYLSYESQQGNISISLKALQDFLGHIKSEFPAIISMNPRVTAKDESLDVLLEVRIKAGAPIPEISRLLQERARLLIQERVGISDIRDVEVRVEEIVRDKESPVQQTTPVAPPPAGETP